MTLEDRIALVLGRQIMTIAALEAQVEELQKVKEQGFQVPEEEKEKGPQ